MISINTHLDNYKELKILSLRRLCLNLSSNVYTCHQAKGLAICTQTRSDYTDVPKHAEFT